MNNDYQSYFTDRETETAYLKWLGLCRPERPLPLCPFTILTVSRERSLVGTIRAPNPGGKGT